MEQWTSASSNVTYASWITRQVFGERGDDAAGSAGVREPRRPIRPLDTTGAALDIPPDELQAAVARGHELAARYGW